MYFMLQQREKKNNAIETCTNDGELSFSITFPNKVEMITR